MFSVLSRVAAILVLSLCMFACDDKVTKDNYDLIKVGMDQTEVENLLGGEGTRLEVGGGSISSGGVLGGAASNSQTTYEWKSGRKIISVTFKDKKVVSMSNSGL